MRMHWLCLASLTVTAVEAEVFDVTKHGAKGDGKTRDDGAIEATFRACAATASGAGTGTGSREVLFPAPGMYITGPWELACNNSVVTIEPGASVVSFTANGSTQGWPIGALTSPEPSQGLTDKQAAPFILSHYARNVTLRGGGTLDAGGRPFWHEHCGNWWCPKWAGPGVTPKSPYAWRPFMLRIDHSTDITIEGLRFEATAFWCIVPVHSEHIEIANLVIHARDSADSGTPNTDGIEPMWSKDVHIHDVSINNGDDCVTVKSGSSDIVAERLDCTNSHGITIGSIWYDDVTNVTYRDCVLHKLHAGPRIKGREQGNATISDIHFENIRLDNVEQAIQIQMTYETPGSKAKNIGCTATGVTYKNITGTATSHGMHTAGSLSCLPTRPCEQIVMEDIHIDVTAATAATAAAAAPEELTRRRRKKKPPAPWECDSAHVASQGTVEPPLPASCTKAKDNESNE